MTVVPNAHRFQSSCGSTKTVQARLNIFVQTFYAVGAFFKSQRDERLYFVICYTFLNVRGLYQIILVYFEHLRNLFMEMSTVCTLSK